MQKKVLLPLAVVIAVSAVGYMLMQKEENPVSQSDNPATVSSENKDESSEQVTSEEGWRNYSSAKFGLSFQYPEKVSNAVSGLDGADGFAPVKVTEDSENGVIYLTYGPSDTLESLRNEFATLEDGTPNPELITDVSYGWMMIIKRVSTDDELDGFVKKYYGSGCYVEKRDEQSQEGVYKLTIKGEDWDDELVDLGSTTCSWGGVYELLQSTDSDTVISINRGQERSFDDEDGILDSIRFN